MSEHRIFLDWKRETPDFQYDTYDRTHAIRFEGGWLAKGSAAPQFKGNADLPNPEELFAAALSACHMLTFLAIAARSHLIVDSYTDEAVAHLGKNEVGKFTITGVTLRPRVKFSEPVDDERFQHMHHKAHENCFIAGATACEVTVEAIQE